MFFHNILCRSLITFPCSQRTSEACAMTTCRSKTFELELQQCACCCSVPAFENMSCLWRNDPVANEETKYVLLFPPRRFHVKDCSSVRGQAQHGLFMMMLAIRSTRALDERVTGSNTCHFVVTCKFTRHDWCTSQAARSFGSVRGSVGSVSAMASDCTNA